jgi:glycosyltransferase involved in cell wall biosynthesis
MLDRKRRIVFLITSLDYGGAQTEIVHLAIGLKNLGWNVRLISMLRVEAFTEKLDRANIPVISLGMSKGIPDPKAIGKLANLLRQWKADILHSHLFHANILSRITRIIVPIPIVISTAHNINEGRRWREIAYRSSDRLADLTTNVSKAAVKRYIQVGAVPANKIMFIPNSIDTEIFAPDLQARNKIRQQLNLENKFVWLAVGRLEEQKDYPNLLQAFARIVREFPETILLICGKGNLQSELEVLTEQLKIQQRVRFLGIRSDIRDIMNGVDAYVMSSAWEGMPIVLLEASAVGLPIVATDVGGNREIILDDRSGFLVPPKDDRTLGLKMQQLMKLSTSERWQMGQIARKYVEDNYSIERTLSKWQQIYDRMLISKNILC